MRSKRSCASAFWTSVSARVKDRGDFRIRHARGGRTTPRRTRAFDVAGGIELHDAAEHEAVFVGAQAADVGRKLLRQHGDGTIGEVDAGAAEASFEIERGVGQNVLRYIGNVDLEFDIRRRGRAP